jgi:sugar/nucleoside kinase (ribokinase family)
MYDVITIGAATRDVFLLSDQFTFIRSDRFNTGVGECVSLGSKVEVQKIVHTTGGGATNAAVTFARLGLHTAVVCRIGDDDAGVTVVSDLKKEKISTNLVRRVRGGTTGYGTLLTATTGERTALVHRGVSSAFSLADLPLSKLKTHWIYLTSLGGHLPLAAKIIRAAATKHIFVAWNPGKTEVQKGLRAFAPLLRHLTVLNMNREEAEMLTDEKEIPSIVKKLTIPEGILLITDGEKGAYAHQNGRTVFSGTRGVKAVSRTGAGDAFGSGFVAAFMKTANLETSLAVATINAESVIQKVGAKAGILRVWPSPTLLKRIPLKNV